MNEEEYIDQLIDAGATNDEISEALVEFRKRNQPKIATAQIGGGGIFNTLKQGWNELVDSYNTPVAEEDRKPFISPDITNAAKRGFNLAEQASILNPYEGTDLNESEIKEIANLQQETQNLPASQSYQNFNNAKTFGEAISTLSKDPVRIIGELTIESLTSLGSYGTARVATGAAMGAGAGVVGLAPGAAAGAGGGAIVGLADSSLGLEYSSGFIQALQEAGVNVSDPEDLTRAFRDQKIIDEARSHAYKKSIPIAIFDLISGGVAGRLFSKPATGIAQRVGRGVAEFGVQASLGAGGELTGQVVAGEEIQPGAILGEAIGELGTTPIEVAANTLGAVRKEAKSVDQRVIEKNQEIAQEIDKAISEMSTGDPALDAQIDEVAQIDPVDQKVLEAENGQDTAEIKPSQTPEYKQAVAAIEQYIKEFKELPDNATDEQVLELRRKLTQTRQTLQQIAGKPKDTRPKTEIQKQIEDTTGVSKQKPIKITPSQAIKAQFDAVTRGMKKGVKLGVEESQKLVDKAREAIKEFNLSDRQVNAILNKVRNTDVNAFGTSKRSVSALNQFIDKVTQDSEYVDKVTEARSINKKLRKLARTKTANLQSYKTLAKAFTTLDPEDAWINTHLKMGNRILSAMSSPGTKKYSSTEVADIESYVKELKQQVEEGRVKIEEQEQEASNDTKGERLERLRVAAKESIERLSTKDLTDFDESERATIQAIRDVNIDALSDDQLSTLIRVADNIIDNDSLINSAQVEAVSQAQKAIQKLKSLLAGKKIYKIGFYGRTFYNVARTFDAMVLDNDLAAKMRELIGNQELYAKGSKIEKYLTEKAVKLKSLAGEFNRNSKTNVVDLSNRVKMAGFTLLVRRPVGSGDQHIPQMKKNIEQTIDVWEEAGEQEKANEWRQFYNTIKDINTTEEALELFKKSEPRLFKVWKFISDTFKDDVNAQLKETTENVHNSTYIEEENYATIRPKQVISREKAKKNFIQSLLNSNPDKKVKANQSKTSYAATRKLSPGQAYSDDFFGDQLRALRESKYDIEASKVKMKMSEIIYSKDWEDLIGRENAAFIIRQTERGDMIQQELGGVPSEEYLDVVNALAQFSRNIGAAKALGSTLGQLLKQVPPVVIKGLVAHIASGTPQLFARAMAIRITPNIDKLLNNSQTGTAGLRLGGIERGNSISYNLAPGAKQKFVRKLQKVYDTTDSNVRNSLGSLTFLDAAAKKRIALSYYLKKLKDLGIEKVNLEEEYKLQSDPKRKEAVAYMEFMIQTTQTASNPAELSAISRNTGNKALNIIKTVLIPFSQYSLEAKARFVVDLRKSILNPSKENFAAVVGDIGEIMTFGAIQVTLMSMYKDILDEAWRTFLGLDQPDEDDEKKERRENQTLYSQINQSVATINPLAIGTLGEAGQTWVLNQVIFARWKAVEDRNISYKKWKNETGGFAYDRDVDWGLLSLGFEPTSENFTNHVNLVDAWANDEIILEDDYGNLKVIDNEDDLQNVLLAKVLVEYASQAGINEADWFNSLRRVHDQELKKRMKEAPVLED